MRRAAVLFEVLLSIAIFTGAALFTLRAVRQGITGLDQRQREARALDLAGTALAMLEAGLIDLADLREGDPAMLAEALGDQPKRFEDGPMAAAWLIDADTQPTEFAGLTLVSVTVTDRSGGDAMRSAGPDDIGVVTITLRQLMRLAPLEAPPYEEDELVADLIDESGGAE
jgi:hypothetical protein